MDVHSLGVEEEDQDQDGSSKLHNKSTGKHLCSQLQYREEPHYNVYTIL